MFTDSPCQKISTLPPFDVDEPENCVYLFCPMARNNLPPQAYTKETLAQAFDWVKDQPPSIREMANTADALVGLFLQSRRRSPETETPIAAAFKPKQHSMSAKEFKSDLMNLAKNLEKFDEPPQFGSRPAPTPEASPPQPSPLTGVTSNQQINIHVPPPQQGTTTELHMHEPQPPKTKPEGLNLDSRSQELIFEVRSRLNLSSDQEAVRMLITLGFEKIKNVLPQS